MTPAKLLFWVLAALMLLPQVSASIALACGAILALSLGNPYLTQTRKLAPKLLSYSIVGLGASMDLLAVAKVGLHGLGYTFVGITATLLLGYALGRLLKTDEETSLLVSAGTAICGGSAIAAVASATHAKDASVSVSSATVFFLNAAALVLFPVIGHWFNLSQHSFGLWSALAIHDTSSVVGATSAYGAEALQIGTTVKLARALWIIPVTLAIGLWRARQNNGAAKANTKKPWFILGFLLAAALVTFFPLLKPAGLVLSTVARRGFVLTLFLIGCGLTHGTIKSVGVRPLIQGIILWVIVGGATLLAVLVGGIT